MKIEGSTICITGGNKGLGAELVKQMLNKSLKIHIIDRSEQILHHEKIIYYKMDLYKQKPRNLPFFDIVISNLGKNIGPTNFIKTSEEEIDEMIEINLKLHIWFFKNVQFRKFVFISSILSFIGLEKYSLYCASKAFLRIFNESLQNEKQNTMIVYPYKIDTKMFSEINDFFTLKASKVAEKIITGIEKDKKEVYIPYIFKPLSIIKKILPSFVINLILYFIVKLFYKKNIKTKKYN